MRRAETVAHGATGDADEIEELLEVHIPQLEKFLQLIEPVLTARLLVVPTHEEVALRLAGATPHRGRWRRVHTDGSIPAGQPALIDEHGTPVLALHPMALFLRASPGAVDELFWRDGGARRGVRYVALPSMAERVEGEALSVLDDLMGTQDPSAGDLEGTPYRGLSAFGPQDEALSCGETERCCSSRSMARRAG